MGYDLPPWKEPAPLNQHVKVLIVDDEASQRSGLAAMVSAWGMTPETASDGNEALLKLNDFEADVILTDLNMPGLDGFGFLQRLRDSGDMPRTIVLTGSIGTKELLVALKLGVLGIVSKESTTRSLCWSACATGSPGASAAGACR